MGDCDGKVVTMFTLRGQPGVYEMAVVWHYAFEEDGVTPDLCGPVCEGRKRCHLAVDGVGHRFDVAPGHGLPAGMHWMTEGEITG